MFPQIPQTTVLLRYGSCASIPLEMPADALVADCNAPQGAPLADLHAALGVALAQPLEFPPLSQAAVPGDRVVLALDAAVPRAAAVVAEVVRVLSARGVEAGDITILRTQDDARTGVPAPLELLPAEQQGAVKVDVHDPRDRDHLSYLAAAGRDHEPVYMNRALCEADLVLPIGCLRCPGTLGYHGIFGGLFPAFSDAASRERVATASASARRSPRDEALAQHQVEEVGWLLGIQFTVQLVPGPGDDVLEVLAGQPEAVFQRGQESCQAAWSFRAARRASLVVSTIRGGLERQTWDNVARAVAAARRVVRDDGAIAVCSELNETPGPALARLASARDSDAALRWIRKHRPYDSAAALEIAEALRETPVYLLSGLTESTVEELGLAPVSDARQIIRLVAHHDSCIVLSDAQYALATASED